MNLKELVGFDAHLEDYERKLTDLEKKNLQKIT